MKEMLKDPMVIMIGSQILGLIVAKLDKSNKIVNFLKMLLGLLESKK